MEKESLNNQSSEQVEEPEKAQEGENAKEAELSKTCPPKLSGAEKAQDLSLQQLEEPEEISRKSLKERVSPSKKEEEQEPQEISEGGQDQKPDSKDLKKVYENPSPREVEN